VTGSQRTAALINPETRVAKLLKEFPELEDDLLRLSPAFAKLRNPILRRTVAKVTTLRQAAKIADLPLADLINALRRAAGFPEMEFGTNEGADEKSRPEWVERLDVHSTFDARPILDEGGNPINDVLSRVDKLPGDRQFVFETPFLPAPLVDILKRRGLRVWSESCDHDLVRTHVAR
jgi:hypothetical protein